MYVCMYNVCLLFAPKSIKICYRIFAIYRYINYHLYPINSYLFCMAKTNEKICVIYEINFALVDLHVKNI